MGMPRIAVKNLAKSCVEPFMRDLFPGSSAELRLLQSADARKQCHVAPSPLTLRAAEAALPAQPAMLLQWLRMGLPKRRRSA